MKYIILLVLVIFGTEVFGQIFPDRHTTNAFDGWISCQESSNPNPAHGMSHWIQYEFTSPISIYDLQIWNLNHPDYLKDGLSKVIIDISNNGSTWTTIDTFTFPKAPASGFYEGFLGPDLNGASAKYLLITGVSNHGGGCYGLSEVRIYTQDKTLNELNLAFTLCENDGLQQNLTGGVAFGGHYSGIGVSDNGDETFDFDVFHAGPGVHEITYTYGGNSLTGEVTVHPCTDDICQECEACKVSEVVDINGNIPSDHYSGYKIHSDGNTINNSTVKFLINDLAELQPGFTVPLSAIFSVDLRTCYENDLDNGGYENGEDPWLFYLNGGATGSFTVVNNESYAGNNSAKIVVQGNGSSDWHVQLLQRDQSMIAGKTYRVSFAAKASHADTPVRATLQDRQTYETYTDESFLLSPQWEVYSFTYIPEVTVIDNIGVQAYFGETANRTFWIDNFNFIQVN